MIQYEGPGWRFIRDISRKKFTVLLGGKDWAVEISEQEWQSLCPSLVQLLDQYQVLKDQLMKEEQIFLEIERNSWWLCLDGVKDAWTLSLILSYEEIQDRSLELSWPYPSAHEISSTIRVIWDSQQ